MQWLPQRCSAEIFSLSDNSWTAQALYTLQSLWGYKSCLCFRRPQTFKSALLDVCEARYSPMNGIFLITQRKRICFVCKWAGDPLCTHFFFHTQAKPNFNFSFFLNLNLLRSSSHRGILDYWKMLDFPMLTKVNDPMKLLQMVFTKCVLGKTDYWKSVGEHLRSSITVLIQLQPTYGNQ